MKPTKLYLAAILLLMATMLHAQMMEPIHFKSELKMLKGDLAEIIFSATIDPGWHVYGTDLGQDGPVEASFHADVLEGAELVGKLQPRGKLKEQYDQMFGMTLRFFELKGAFVQTIRFTKPQYNISCYLEYGACNDEMCLPPSQAELRVQGKSPVAVSANQAPSAIPADKQMPAVTTDNTQPAEATQASTADSVAAADDAQTATDTNSSDDQLWAPITADLQAFEQGAIESNTTEVSWLTIFLEGLLGGFLAILTPCVWPIIPMTVSFFLKRNKERRKAIREAITYGVSIVVIYVLLGLAVTMLFGASALNALSTNAVFNIIFALLLVVFAASFFGAFELTLPSSWSNKIDQKAESTTGLLSIFLMAFTLTLVSFSCTGPIIGFLLVAVSTQGSIVAPTIGMLGFAIALAIPFTLFALFPSLLKSAPKSGGWMNTVNVVLGFI